VARTVVFDTNILFSATGWQGRPYLCVERARTGAVTAVTCPELMDELAEKLEGKLGFSAEQAAETLADYLSFIRLANIPGSLQGVARDPDDNMVLECALAAKADYIVSGDLDLLVLKIFRGVRIVRASEFLDELSSVSK
jgi:uncharacterized protein